MPLPPGAGAAVLVGGHSRRMGGRPKALLPLGGSTVLERVLAALAPLPLPVHLVLPHPQARPAAGGPDQLEGLARRLGLPVLSDLRPDAGPLGGLEAGLATGAERLLLLACDLPFLSAPFLTWLLDQAAGTLAAVPAEGQRLHPLCAVYSAACRPHVDAALEAGHLRLHDFVRSLGARLLPRQAWAAFDPAGRLLSNLNQPDDYERARQWVEETDAARRGADGPR